MSTTLIQAMITYSTAMLQAISDWLSAGPMLLMFGLICGAFVINFILTFINLGRRN